MSAPKRLSRSNVSGEVQTEPFHGSTAGAKDQVGDEQGSERLS